MEPMKILIIAPSAYFLGGVQDWLYMVSLGLRSRGHCITIGVPNNKFHRLDNFNHVFQGIQAKGFTNQSGTAEGRIRALAQFLVENRSDLIVGVNIGDLYEAYRRELKNLCTSRIAFTLHAIEANYFLDIKAYTNILDAVVVTNRLSGKLVQRLSNIENKRIFYAPYGVEINKSIKQVNSFETVNIAWVGRVDNTQKRASDLVMIVRELDRRGINYKLSIAGDGEYMSTLKQDLEFWLKNERVRLAGVLSKKELSVFYLENDILLLTSEWETGPIVAWEAMTRGLVVVSSMYIGHKAEKALKHNHTALLYPIGDWQKAGDQIQRLIDPAVRKRISTQGRKVATSRYSQEASLKTWEKTFESIISLSQKHKDENIIQTKGSVSGRLESVLGLRASEKVRSWIPLKREAGNAGDEWPHSLQGQQNQSEILNYAREIEGSIR